MSPPTNEAKPQIGAGQYLHRDHFTPMFYGFLSNVSLSFSFILALAKEEEEAT
jgi:hypothetical protein